MNETLLQMKKMGRAMQSYVLLLYEIVLESKPDWILEIGVGQAQSTRTILSALKENKKGMLVSIDIRDRIKRIPDDLLPYWHLIVGNSHNSETLEEVEMTFPEQLDLLFIDGDHSYEGVKKDFEMYSLLVKKDGLIILHDICNENEGVKDFWKEIKYPKVALRYGKAANDIVPGLGIVQRI